MTRYASYPVIALLNPSEHTSALILQLSPDESPYLQQVNTKEDRIC